MTVFCSTSADFRSLSAGSTHKPISGGGGRKRKSADVKWKTVTLIYPDPHLYKNKLIEGSYEKVGRTIYKRDVIIKTVYCLNHSAMFKNIFLFIKAQVFVIN